MADFFGLRLDRLAWGLLGLAVTAIVAYVVWTFVGAIVTGIFLYYATRLVRDWLDQRSDHPDVNAAVALLTVGIPLLVILGYAAYVGIQELNQFLAMYRLERFRTLLAPYLALPPLGDWQAFVGYVRANADQLYTLLLDLFVWAGRLFVAIVVAFYLLRDDEDIAAWFRRSVGEDHDAISYFEGVDDSLDTVYTGNLLTVAITVAIAATTFFAFDYLAPGSPTIRYPILLGLLTAVFTLVPVIGIKGVYLPYTGFLLVRSVVWNQLPIWVPIAFLVVTAVVVDFVPDLFIRSYLSKGEMNMGLMLLAYTLGVIVFGWYGLFLGPLVLVLFLHFAWRVFPNVVDLGAIRLVDDEWGGSNGVDDLAELSGASEDASPGE